MKKALLTFGSAIVTALVSIAQIGTIDPNFNLGTGFGPDQWTGKCETIWQQSDGKLLVGGQFETFNGDTVHYIARLNLDGTLDESFESPFDESWGAVINKAQVLADGKILVSGYNLASNNVAQPGIVRLNSDGSIDPGFNAPASVSGCSVFDIQSDGKIVLGNLMRLNSDGTLDSSFDTGTGISGGTGFGGVRVNNLVIQSDGKILIAGHYGGFNGDTSKLLTRLNDDGTIDNTFDANANFSASIDGFYGQIFTLKVLSNGKIMIGGNYGNNNSLAFGVDRLNSDGSLDSSFNIMHTTTSLRNYALAIQADGKVFAANVNFGPPSEAFVVERYNTDGSLDTTYPKKYLNNDVTDLIVQTDGNISFVGYFNYNPTGIMRLIGDTPLSNARIENTLIHCNIYPNPTSQTLNIENVPMNSTLRIVDPLGRTIKVHESLMNTFKTIDVSSLSVGTYYLLFESSGTWIKKKFIVSE